MVKLGKETERAEGKLGRIRGQACGCLAQCRIAKAQHMPGIEKVPDEYLLNENHVGSSRPEGVKG